jgi:hypothetical protein
MIAWMAILLTFARPEGCASNAFLCIGDLNPVAQEVIIQVTLLCAGSFVCASIFLVHCT